MDISSKNILWVCYNEEGRKREMKKKRRRRKEEREETFNLSVSIENLKILETSSRGIEVQWLVLAKEYIIYSHESSEATSLERKNCLVMEYLITF